MKTLRRNNSQGVILLSKKEGGEKTCGKEGDEKGNEWGAEKLVMLTNARFRWKEGFQSLKKYKTTRRKT